MCTLEGPLSTQEYQRREFNAVSEGGGAGVGRKLVHGAGSHPGGYEILALPVVSSYGNNSNNSQPGEPQGSNADLTALLTMYVNSELFSKGWA